MSRERPVYRKILLLTRKELESVQIARRIDSVPLLEILGRIHAFISPELLPQPWIDIVNAPDVLLLDTDSIHIPKAVLGRLTPQLAQTYRIVPLSVDREVLTLATGEELDARRLNDLQLLFQTDCTGAICTPAAMEALLDHFYPMSRAERQRLKEGMEETPVTPPQRPQPPEESPDEFVDALLIQAVSLGVERLLFVEGPASLKILSVRQGAEQLVDYLPKGFGHSVMAELNDRLGLAPGDLRKTSSGEALVKVSGRRIRLRLAQAAGPDGRQWTLHLQEYGHQN
ncbi:MAG: hypothetical protein HYU36_10590 [Planctomycetes bacterium]|nr:hypothetical protein [Planctomycetota bacterium]